MLMAGLCIYFEWAEPGDSGNDAYWIVAIIVALLFAAIIPIVNP
jgi:hypothetical protein